MRILPLLLLVMVFSSGCTIPDFPFIDHPVETGNGVVITDFRPELQRVYSGESVDFYLKIKNMGSFHSENGDARIEIGQWNCQPNSLYTTQFDSLLPIDREKGIEGQELDIVWTCTPPEIDETLHIPFTARACVEYDYQTVTTSTVPVLSIDELKDLINSGKTLDAIPKSTTLGPVSLDVYINGPVRLKNDESIEFPVTISINNVGGGNIKDSKVNLKVTGNNIIQKLASDECSYDDLHVWRDREQTITCEMRAVPVDSLTYGEVTAKITYTYVATAETQIDLVGEKAYFLR